MFKPVDENVSFPQMEEKIIEFWKKNKIFEESIENRPKNKRWNFLDGPPFITGLPHYGSLLSSIPKDVFPRFQTMRGYRVRRVWGWDCHGLPAENKVENKLGIKRKKDIEEKVGVKKFIDECKLYVSEVSSEWEWYVDHIGRWVDFKNAYKTMDLPYMESVMWVFKQMYEKGYIYKGLRVSLYCPHCATPISNFEVAMDSENYKEVLDSATTYKYKLKSQNSNLKTTTQNAKLDTYILAWSTTPWNKLVTPALAVNPTLIYVKVKQGSEYYILAKSALKILKSEPLYEIVEEFKGKKLISKKFVPHYDYYKKDVKPREKVFEIIGGDFVTAEEGTGVVTIAAYGEEDLKVMQEQNIHIEMHLDEEGIIKPDVPLFGGLYYLKANKLVNEDLAKRGLIYKDEELPHNVPLCWRCHTRLYYGPQDAWYVNVQKLKNKMEKTNEFVNWFPKHFKYGRFLKSLQAAPDWNISRSRYWGSPVPVWECACGERFVPGSIKELEEASGTKIKDLHKPEIDEITVKCKKCGKLSRRVPEVLDSWIEAGSASFAERHFPFDLAQGKPLKLEDFFPPDFIAEYTGQIRAWFYVLHVIGTALYDSPAFKNVLVEGVILGTDGRKMSKNYGNYPDPKEMLTKYGGDALRLYLLGSPVMHGEDILISEEQYRNQVKDFLLILWNVYKFFIMYANIDKVQSSKFNPFDKLRTRVQSYNSTFKNILDQWIIARLDQTIRIITSSLEGYDTVETVKTLNEFIDDISTWYIRRSRDRVGPTASNTTDKQAFYSTSYEVLVNLTKLMAPITPFIAEELYKNLTGEKSVHLAQWPEEKSKIIRQLTDQSSKFILEEMNLVRKICELGHAQRKLLKIKVRQPLRKFKVQSSIHSTSSGQEFKVSEELLELVKDELNVKEVEINQGTGELSVEFDTIISPELKAEGEAREIIREIQKARKAAGCLLDEQITVKLPSYPKEKENLIKTETLAKTIVWGENLRILRG